MAIFHSILLSCNWDQILRLFNKRRSEHFYWWPIVPWTPYYRCRSQQNQKDRPFLRIAPELRNQSYVHLFIMYILRLEQSFKNRASITLDLLITSRQIYADVRGLRSRSVTFFACSPFKFWVGAVHVVLNPIWLPRLNSTHDAPLYYRAHGKF